MTTTQDRDRRAHHVDNTPLSDVIAVRLQQVRQERAHGHRRSGMRGRIQDKSTNGEDQGRHHRHGIPDTTTCLQRRMEAETRELRLAARRRRMYILADYSKSMSAQADLLLLEMRMIAVMDIVPDLPNQHDVKHRLHPKS